MKKRKLPVSPFLLVSVFLAPVYILIDRYVAPMPEWVSISVVAIQLACVAAGIYTTFKDGKEKKSTDS